MKFSNDLASIGRQARNKALGVYEHVMEPENDPVPSSQSTTSKRRSKKSRTLLISITGILASLLLIGGISGFMLLPPLHFPVGVVVRVEDGWSLKETANYLKSRGIIRSRAAFMLGIRHVYGGDESIQAGDYYFSESGSVLTIAKKVSEGEFGMVPFAVTLPEGLTVEEMAKVFESKLSDFNTEEFIKLAKPLEGYLFPDTYYFLPTARPRNIVREMYQNFQIKIAELEEYIANSGKSLEEIVIMASIVEKEAENDDTARKKIAGVLWKRIEINMPLQVDASFRYLLGKGTFDITMEDLEMDSPYNTYKYTGLPPGPISNPGLASIRAALEPIETEYLFFLADMTGKTHFARTFAQHKWNIRRFGLHLN